jgi:beta-barrel assembly-enhancing protease
LSQEGTAYLGNATHPALGDAEVAGKLFAHEYALKFVSEAGEVELPYDAMEISFGTRKDPRVTFTSGRQPDCVLVASNEDITRELAFRRNGHLRRQVEAWREQVEGRRRLVLTALFCGVFVGLSALAGVAVEWLMPRLIDRVPVAWEKELGQKVAAEVRKEFKVSGDTNVAAQLTTLVTRLTKALPKHEYEFRVTLLADPEPNAFALPGGGIFVNMGLLRLCTNTVEVAGVLAHEISHVTRRHGLRTMVTTVGPAKAVGAVLGDSHGFLSALAAGSHLLVGMSFSRDFEREADEGGFDLMLAAGLDPRGLEQGLKRIQQFEQRMGGGGAPNALRTHPPTPERMERLAAKWQAATKKSGFATLEPLKLPPPEKGKNLFDRLDDLLDKR